MAREQILLQLSVGPFTTTAVQLSATSILTTSFIIQCPSSNSDFVKIGNALGQTFQIAPGKDLAVRGDALDVGTNSYVDLSKWFVSAQSGSQSVNIMYLDRI